MKCQHFIELEQDFRNREVNSRFLLIDKEGHPSPVILSVAKNLALFSQKPKGTILLPAASE